MLLSHPHRSVSLHCLSLHLLTQVAGIGLSLILAPLAADMFDEVDVLIDTYPATFGKAGAYVQACSISCCAMGIATAAGPIVAGVLFEKTGWLVTQSVLAILCALGSLVVFRYIGRRDSATNYVRFEDFPNGD